MEDKYPPQKDIVIYGIGMLGEVLVRLLQGHYHVRGILDMHPKADAYQGIPVAVPGDAPASWQDAQVIVTPLGDTSSIHRRLKTLGYSDIMDIKELVSLD